MDRGALEVFWLPWRHRPVHRAFGTVWGIMHSFAAIASMHNTNLAVVAPGIAEALFATAIGLVAAIPAVLAYNKISNDLARFASRLEGFGAEFSAILSRQSEERA
jgi:biopolymer transport protein TolQ